MSDFMEILKREVEAASVASVARKIGYARTSVSNLLNGNYPGNPHKIGARIIEVFSTEIACPYLKRNIAPAECRAMREGAMPTNNAGQLRHWTACRNCPNNPGPVDPRLHRGRADRKAGKQNWWNK